jgi:hypothetical protein
LEDLQNELIEGQRLAADERGSVLVWTGDTVSVALTLESMPDGAREVVKMPEKSRQDAVTFLIRTADVWSCQRPVAVV